MDKKIPIDPRELACYLNAQHNLRIVQGIGKESRECGVYDPQYDTEILAKALNKVRRQAFAVAKLKYKKD